MRTRTRPRIAGSSPRCRSPRCGRPSAATHCSSTSTCRSASSAAGSATCSPSRCLTTIAWRRTSARSRQVAVVRRALDEGGDFTFARAASGGGTPTLLAAGQLARVMQLLAQVGMTSRIPMSVETSPETALPDRLAVVVAGGAGRISMGVQSFIEAECKAVNRPQQTADVHRALRAIRDAGPATLNVDLMYGLPGDRRHRHYSLVAALEYRPEELYLYPLYIRPLTTLGRKQAEAVDRDRVGLYEQGRDLLLAAGYRQVSMRMFRRAAGTDATGMEAPVYVCQDDGMLGLGVGARSYTRGVHYSSEWAVGARGVRQIIDRWIAKPDASFGVADYGFVLDADEQRRRWLILSLLSDDGLELASYHRRFAGAPTDHFPELATLLERGLASADDRVLRLTTEGLARADQIGPWLGSPGVRARMDTFELS
ncbi:MAG: STM4012 family radical SAM protein [Kofleriaceae bacterium]